MADVFRAKNLNKSYGGRRVVRDVDIEVHPGEVVGLLGPNGAGKTTIFSIMLGIERADAGSVHLDDTEVTHLPLYKRARLGIGYLPQEASVFRKLTAFENLLVVMEHMGMGRAARLQKAELSLKEFGIFHVAGTMAYKLSGGERRRLEICRALIAEPSFLLLDEPFAGIDPIAVEDLQKLIGDIRKKQIGIVITDHNVRETLRICDRAYLIHRGALLMSGSPDAISADPRAREVYLGEGFAL